MAVLTISGQAGSRAPEIGRLVAEQLHFDYVDREILVEAATALGVPMESVVPLDERTASLGERLAAMLRRFLERSAAAGAADPMLGSGGLDVLLGRSYSEAAAAEIAQEVSGDQYFSALTDIIGDLASNDDVVIIGRGSQMILKDHPGAVHILLVGPPDYRVRQFALREGLEEEEACKRVQDIDKGRAAFHSKFFKIDVDDPTLYHLTLNTERFSPEETAQMISEFAQRAAQARPPA